MRVCVCVFVFERVYLCTCLCVRVCMLMNMRIMEVTIISTGYVSLPLCHLSVVILARSRDCPSEPDDTAQIDRQSGRRLAECHLHIDGTCLSPDNIVTRRADSRSPSRRDLSHLVWRFKLPLIIQPHA